jgi:hypothetical protein
MRMMMLAAGLAVGYVLGTRAGRPAYDRIADGARRLTGAPEPAVAARERQDGSAAL